MKKSKGIRNGIISVVIIGLIGMAYISTTTTDYSIFYEEGTATQGDLETYYTFNGNLQSQNVQNVVAESNTFISDILVEEEQDVEDGDVLVELSDGSEITAKQNGTVSDIYVEKEQPVTLGTPLMDIYDFNNFEVAIKVDEYDLNSLEIGKEMTVYVNALDKELTGTVTDISDTATTINGVAFFTAIIELPEDDKLKVGMTAEAKTLNQSAENVVYIPMKAINVGDDGGAYVYVKNEKGDLVKENVEVGINDGQYIEITDGLNKNDIYYYQKNFSFDSTSYGQY